MAAIEAIQVTDRKKPGVAFWATVVVVVALVGYPLSFGPFLWASYSFDLPPTVLSAGKSFYRPCTRQMSKRSPRCYGRYCDWWYDMRLGP
jgi:hypothetical protein